MYELKNSCRISSTFNTIDIKDVFETIVDICDPRGTYPKENLYTDDMGYFVYKKIPFRIRTIKLSKDSDRLQWVQSPNEELFYAAILFTKKDFPAFNFWPLCFASIIIKSEIKLHWKQIASKIKKIIDRKVEMPVLYDPYNKHNFDEAQKIIKKIRAKKEYIDLFHQKKIPLKKQFEILSNSFNFPDWRINSTTVKKYYNLFIKSSRYIHIALHYFINASRLVHCHFVEDAGINLQLTVEAIIKDFMHFHCIKDKKVAIERLKQIIKLPHCHMEFLDELYESRNEFLAHIDEDMYTGKQKVSDPDRYCYEHFESIHWLITRYIKHKEI